MNIHNILHSIKANVDYAKTLETVFSEYYFNDSVKQYNFIIQFAIKSDNFYFKEEQLDLNKLKDIFKSIDYNIHLQLINKYRENHNKKTLTLSLKQKATIEEYERFLYRERGINRISRKENYKKYGDILGINLIKRPSFASNPFTSCRIAMEFWNINDCDNKINNIEELTKTVQGECNSFYIQKVKELMKALKIY